MIDIAELKQKDIGRWVLYRSPAGEKEKGKIKSWNSKYIFIVYQCDHQWHKFHDYTAAATNPCDLRFTSLEEVI